MAKYTYSIDLYTEAGAEVAETVIGEVEADRYSSACVKAWAPIGEACKRITEATGLTTSVGDIHVERLD